MVSEFNVYCAYKAAEVRAKNRKGFNVPKNWEDFLEKMKTKNPNNSANLYRIMVHFNTTYSNINIDEYMTCGFMLWKSFSYHMFCDKKIINLYVQRDKNKKRKIEASHEDIERSFSVIKSYLNGKPLRDGYCQLQNFCKFRDGEVRVIINKYNQNEVDALTLVYCIKERYLILTDDERELITYVSTRYRELVENLNDVSGLIKQKERELDEKHG